jgi:phosphohistidine phosphatase
MDLYLVQHGEAHSEEEDPVRPLTARGRLEVERIARAAARAGLAPRRIAHSGKLRARETAEILAGALTPAEGVREMPALGPKDDPAAIRSVLEEATDSLMLVGHLPHLCRVASLLLVGDPEREIVAFRMGGVVCLGREREAWRVRFVLTPELVP